MSVLWIYYAHSNTERLIGLIRGKVIQIIAEMMEKKFCAFEIGMVNPGSTPAATLTGSILNKHGLYIIFIVLCIMVSISMSLETNKIRWNCIALNRINEMRCLLSQQLSWPEGVLRTPHPQACYCLLKEWDEWLKLLPFIPKVLTAEILTGIIGKYHQCCVAFEY